MTARSKSSKIFYCAVLFFISALAGYCFFAAADRFSAEKETKGLYTVSEVIDGDTIKVYAGSGIETIRLIGINAPEKSSPYREEECFGVEASAEADKMLSGSKVFLEADPMVSDKDKYGRLLRYVFMPDGRFVNAELVAGGFAFNYPYENFQYLKYFNGLENRAKSARLGLWGEKCDYYSGE